MKLGLPDGGSKPTTSTERQAYDVLTEGLGPGFNGHRHLVIYGLAACGDRLDRPSPAA